jgi:hypothetical protein
MRHSLIADHLNVARDRYYWLILPDMLQALGFSAMEAGRQIAWYLVFSPTWQ